MSLRGVWQLKKLVVQYCDWGGSSRGMRDFMQTRLAALQALNPQLEVETTLARGRHPYLHGYYANGRDRVVDVKNAKLEKIEEQAQRLRNAAGRKVLKLKSRHVSSRPSIQGPWRPGVALQ